MEKYLDAFGKACPMPVIMAKKELDGGAQAFTIGVDNDIAVENLKKLGASQNCQVETKVVEGGFHLHFMASADGTSAQAGVGLPEDLAACPVAEPAPAARTWAAFIGKDIVGQGDDALGHSLIRMYFYTISQAEHLPASILFMNNGVKLPTGDEQVIEHLKVLEEKGVEILVCGTCLDYYGLKDELKVGTISNMYDITERMAQADKVITL